MLTATQSGLMVLDLLKSHHPDAVDASTDRELLGYALTDLCHLAEGLGVRWDAICAAAAVDARHLRERLGPVDTAAFQPPAIAAE